MSINILLDDKINKIFKENPELEKTEKDTFEISVAEILKLKFLNGIDTEDLLDGIIGGGGDEGIDMCYLFNDDELVDDSNVEPISKTSILRLELFQAKKESGFSTNAFQKLCDGVEEIFNLDEDALRNIGANPELLKKAELIRKIFRKAKEENAKFELNINFVTSGNTSDITQKIQHRKEKLIQNLKLLLDGINFRFIGAQELINFANKSEDKITLRIKGAPLDLREEGKSITGFACFIGGTDLINSFSDDEGKLIDNYFDMNVRDFLGLKPINDSMIQTALSDHAENFWAMNNGITVVGDSVRTQTSTSIIVDNPQVVNGCQTMHSLHEASLQNTLSDDLKVFVKIIEVKDAEIQQDIINASNSQNTVDYSSLKANDQAQRNIEEFLKKNGFFYERRKNYYKRKGKTGLSVVSIKKLGQIVHTIFQKEAIIAVNDIKKIFENEDRYQLVFNKNVDYDIYLFGCLLYKNIWALKMVDLKTSEYEPEKKELISKSLFCLLHIAASLLLKSPYKMDIRKSGNLLSINKKEIFKKIETDCDSIYEEALNIFLSSASAYQAKYSKSSVSLFKDRKFDSDFIVPAIKKYLEKK